MLALTAPPCVMCHHGFPVGLTYFNKCLLSWIYEYWAFGLEKVYFPYDEQVVFDRDEAVSATPKICFDAFIPFPLRQRNHMSIQYEDFVPISFAYVLFIQ